jgi:hypothetical protein
MALHQCLGDGKAQTHSLRARRNHGIKNLLLNFRGHPRAVIDDFYLHCQLVMSLTHGAIALDTGTQQYASVTTRRLRGIAYYVQQRLDELLSVRLQYRQARIVIAVEAHAEVRLGRREILDVFEYFVNVHGRPLAAAVGCQHSIDEIAQPVRLADDDLRIFPEGAAVQFPFQQLRRAAKSAQRVLDFVGHPVQRFLRRFMKHGEIFFAPYPDVGIHVDQLQDQ